MCVTRLQLSSGKQLVALWAFVLQRNRSEGQWASPSGLLHHGQQVGLLLKKASLCGKASMTSHHSP